MKLITGIAVAMVAVSSAFAAAQTTSTTTTTTKTGISPVVPGTWGLAKWIVVASGDGQTRVFVLVGRAIQPADKREIGTTDYRKIEIPSTTLRDLEQKVRAQGFSGIPHTTGGSANRTLKIYLDGKWKTIAYPASGAGRDAFDLVWNMLGQAEARMVGPAVRPS